jgi:hypothetical protein
MYLQRQSFSLQPSSGSRGDSVDRYTCPDSFPTASQQNRSGTIFTARHWVVDRSVRPAVDDVLFERFDRALLPDLLDKRNTMATATIASAITL